jgi:hypothetical protein
MPPAAALLLLRRRLRHRRGCRSAGRFSRRGCRPRLFARRQRLQLGDARADLADAVPNLVEAERVASIADPPAGAAGDRGHTFGAEHERDDQREDEQLLRREKPHSRKDTRSASRLRGRAPAARHPAAAGARRSRGGPSRRRGPGRGPARPSSGSRSRPCPAVVGVRPSRPCPAVVGVPFAAVPGRRRGPAVAGCSQAAGSRARELERAPGRVHRRADAFDPFDRPAVQPDHSGSPLQRERDL